jgi:DNA modification methylase
MNRENCEVYVNTLKPYDKNSRKHSDEQIDKLVRGIKEYGWTAPIIIDENDMILAGHARQKAAIKAEIPIAPAVRISGLTEVQKRALVIWDNRSALDAEWDDDILAAELSGIAAMGFNMDLTGFTGLEIGKISGLGTAEVAEDDLPEPPVVPVSVLGDIWQLGAHRVACGDSTSVTDVEKLLAGDKVDMVYTDLPYGISIVSKRGKIGTGKLAKTGTYAPVAGDDSVDVAVEAIHVIKTLRAKTEIIWGGNYYASHLPDSNCWVVWDKENSTTDFADAELAWTNQKSAVRIFRHQWMGMLKKSEHGEKRVHPTQKPVALAEWCIEKYGEDCNIILDMFGGSGSTLIACEKMNRQCRIIELVPHYCDVIIKRWMALTGKEAFHVVTGLPWKESA